MENGSGVRIPKQAVRILGLLVESGMIYILIGVSSASVYKHEFPRTLFSLQVMNLTSHAILLHFQLGVLTDVFMPVGIQLVVRNSFKRIALGLY
jgi:hypothetical protein